MSILSRADAWLLTKARARVSRLLRGRSADHLALTEELIRVSGALMLICWVLSLRMSWVLVLSVFFGLLTALMYVGEWAEVQILKVKPALTDVVEHRDRGLRRILLILIVVNAGLDALNLSQESGVFGPRDIFGDSSLLLFTAAVYVKVCQPSGEEEEEELPAQAKEAMT